MSMYSQEWKWCPWCGHELVAKQIYDAERMACPRCDFIYFPRPNVVVMTIVEHQGAILLGRRRMQPGKGKWSLIAGYVNRDQHVPDAAVREVKEETGLDVEIVGLIGIYDDLPAGLVLGVYSARVRQPDVVLKKQAQEIGELAFFQLDALPELAFPGDTQIIADWRKTR